MTRAILGREAWVSRLHSEVDRTVAAHGGLVLIAGEAGIGKTTLVGSVIQHAREVGALVAVGTCSPAAGAPALWPWTQIMRGLQRAGRASDLAAAIADAGLDLNDWLSPPTETESAAVGDDPDFAIADATAGLLSSLSHHVPLVLVLEDLHWADARSVQVLDFVARHCWFERVLLIGTYRDTEVDDPGHPLHGPIAQLTPQAGTIQVTGLDTDAVTDLVTQVAGREPSAAFAADLHRRTGGNPFFLEQLARLWVTGHGEDVPAPGGDRGGAATPGPPPGHRRPTSGCRRTAGRAADLPDVGRRERAVHRGRSSRPVGGPVLPVAAERQPDRVRPEPLLLRARPGARDGAG